MKNVKITSEKFQSIKVKNRVTTQNKYNQLFQKKKYIREYRIQYDLVKYLT